MSVSTAQHILDILLGVLGLLACLLILCLVCYSYARIVFILGDLCSKLKTSFLRRFSIRYLSEEICGRTFFVFDKLCSNLHDDPGFSTFRSINPNLDLLFTLFALSVICYANTFSKRLSCELFVDIKTCLLLRHQQSRSDRLSKGFLEICSFNVLGEIATLDCFAGYLDIFLEDYLAQPSSRQSLIVPLLRYAFIVIPDTSRISIHGKLDFS